MNTTSHRVGTEILSLCNKCKLSLSHLIVAMTENNSIAKVKCKTCQSVHKFKDPNAPKAKTKRKDPTSFLRRPTPTVYNILEDAINKAQNPPRDYSIREKFSLGELIEHAQFGTGLVESLLEHDKIKVIFKADQKTLLHNKNLK